ncbi:bacterial transcriptional activator domain-containing protein [Streptomyces sp. NPDC050535]|uniref:bacterial transcriptional activator domain-containing protein n=1 Tax=Streptomyces sp. NPDC050535 TaxID=3365626 RepID=UPI00379C3375
MRGPRRALGNDPTRHAYVPRRRSSGEDPHQLAASVRCDWTRFVEFAECALSHGLAALPDLERALGLVQGRPFGSRPLPWAEPHQQEMITRIIDVAHTIATHRTPPGPHHDLTAARHAITTGLSADDSAELLYRDWICIEHAAGNRPELHAAITRIQQINRALDCYLESETEQLTHALLRPTHAE